MTFKTQLDDDRRHNLVSLKKKKEKDSLKTVGDMTNNA